MRVLFYWYALAVRMAKGSLHDHDPMHDDVPPIMRGDAPPGMFTPRWAELQQTYGIERLRGANCEIYIHKIPQDHGLFPMTTWARHVATPDLWPEELIDDIAGWFDDLRGRWPEVEWWVQRIHGSSSSSRMTMLQQVNYVLITRRDFEAFARNPHGLMELGFRDPQLHTTVLPRLLNLYILRTFLAPLLEGIQPRLTLRAFLNGIALDHRLVGVESGFYLERDIESALRGRFQDLAQDNFGTGLVHLSYYLTEPVADPCWDIRLLIPVVEDDITPVVLFKAVLSTYEGQGAIYVPPTLNKQTLLAETGLQWLPARVNPT